MNQRPTTPRGWTFVEMLVAISLSAIFMGAASLVLASITANSKRLSTVLTLNIGAANKNVFYAQGGDTVGAYSAPNFGRAALAQEFRDLLREDIETAAFVHCLPRSLANTGVANDTTYELPDGKGRATLRANATVPLRNDTTGLHSQDGATPLRSASTTLLVDLFDGAGETRWGYRLRNQHPALGGDLLSLHAPAVPGDSSALVSGNLRVKGRAVFWDAVVRDVSSGIRADEYLPPTILSEPRPSPMSPAVPSCR